MTNATVVRYTTRPDCADENERLIGAVFRALADQQPTGLHYTAVRLDDGVSFVHLAWHDDDNHNPLTSLAEFQAFTAGIAGRCVEGPIAVTGTPVGSYSRDDSGHLES